MRSLRAALDILRSSNPSQPIKFRRIPFFLEPGYLSKEDGFTETHDERMTRKFGSLEAFRAQRDRHNLVGRGNAVGLDAAMGYTQDNLSKRVQSSTLDAHRLILWIAQEHGIDASEDLYSAIQDKHFTCSGVLADHGLLVSTAVALGHDEQAITNFLASGRGREQVLQLYDRALELGVTSIPKLIVDGRGGMVVQGAETSEELAQLFTRFLQQPWIKGEGVFMDIKI